MIKILSCVFNRKKVQDLLKCIQKMIVVLLGLLLVLPTVGMAAAWPTPPSGPVQPTKEWKVTFNQAVDVSSSNLAKIYVLDAQGTKVGNLVSISPTNAKIVVVAPPTNGYQNRATYTLHIDRSITVKQKSMKDHVDMPFSIVAKATEEPIVDYKQLVLGTWKTTYSGFSIKATFHEGTVVDVDAGISKSTGSYTINGSTMNLNIIGKNVTGEITKVSDTQFTVTTSAGKQLTFTK